MTKQEIFDKVSEHLLRQNAKAHNDCGKCVYRAPDGKKCAVGCLIPDELYKSYFECRSIYNLVTDNDIIKDFLGIENLELLKSLQMCHDDTTVENWKARLEIIARQHELVWSHQ